MTGSSGGQPDQHRKGGRCRWKRCSLDAERRLGDWALWFWSRECDADRWSLAAGSWDCDCRRSNHPWGLLYVHVHASRQNTVARLHINESVRPSETSSGSSENWGWHLTLSKDLSRGWFNAASHSFRAAASMASRFHHLYPLLPFASSRVPFSGHCLWPSPLHGLAKVRKDLWRCENNARRHPCSSMLHHREIYIEHTYWNPTMPVCTQLGGWICDAEQCFLLVETGLQLQAGTGSFPSCPAHSNERCPHMAKFLVWSRGKQAQITRVHCTCRVLRASL